MPRYSQQKKGKVERKQPVSRSKRAGLHFPVGRFVSKLKNGKFSHRVSEKSAIFLGSVIEYLTSTILELSIEYMFYDRKKQVRPHHIRQAIMSKTIH